MVLSQHTPQGMVMTPHFFNYGDTEVDTKNRRISHLIHRATGLPGPLDTPFPCQNLDSHPIKSGTAQRTELPTELIRSTSFTLTIYTVPYPQGHSGPQANEHPLTATPFLFDRRDATPVYRLMYQTFSDSLHDRQPTEVSSEPQHTLAAMVVIREGDGSTPPPELPYNMGLRPEIGGGCTKMVAGHPHPEW